VLRAIHVLADNKAASPEFTAEHGLSLLLEMDDGRTIVWDTGQSGAFLDNAAKMGLDPGRAAFLALSHGHYDHSGGLAALVSAGYNGPVLGHPDALVSRFKIKRGRLPESIGFRPVPGLFEAAGRRLAAVEAEAELVPGARMLTRIARRPGEIESVADFYFDRAGLSADRVKDDACLAVDSRQGLVVVLGCCHSGLANTLAAVGERLGEKPVFAVVGGFHLCDATDAEVARSVAVLRESGVRRVYPGHCTGEAASAAFKQALPGRVEEIAAGMRLSFA
jgi:7,8-dihydropterin-6-yl-methyl-4-(beta-D-ribofuranosyl)aminobenzene 5'-phosphate synthase